MILRAAVQAIYTFFVSSYDNATLYISETNCHHITDRPGTTNNRTITSSENSNSTKFIKMKFVAIVVRMHMSVITFEVKCTSTSQSCDTINLCVRVSIWRKKSKDCTTYRHMKLDSITFYRYHDLRRYIERVSARFKRTPYPIRLLHQSVDISCLLCENLPILAYFCSNRWCASFWEQWLEWSRWWRPASASTRRQTRASVWSAATQSRITNCTMSAETNAIERFGNYLICTRRSQTDWMDQDGTKSIFVCL